MIDFYKKMKEKEAFFTSYFDKLAGNYELKEQIKAGMDEEAILKTWNTDLTLFKSIRKQYLLYPDFE